MSSDELIPAPDALSFHDRFESLDIRLRAIGLDLLDLRVFLGTECPGAVPSITAAYASVQDVIRSLSFADATSRKHTVDALIEALPK